MKIVLDTNVFISAVFFGGPPGEILHAWRVGHIQIVLSPEIFEEYQEVGSELARRYPGIDIFPILDLMKIHAQWLNVTPREIPACQDPADVKFILCAIEGGVNIIVSGDKHLVQMNGFQDITVLRPTTFIEKHLRQKKK